MRTKVSYTQLNSMIMLKLINLFLIALLFFSCMQEKSPMETCFEKVQDNFEFQITLEHIKTAPTDSLFFFYPFFSQEYLKLQEETDCQIQITNWLDANLIKQHNSYREQILFIGFQKYLQEKKIDLKEIEVEIQKMEERKIEKAELQYQQLLDIIEANDSNWKKGDTLNLVLQLSSHGDGKHIFFRRYPASLDYSTADDTLKMRGILIDKIYKDEIISDSEINDYSKLKFRLKILSLNFDNVFSAKKLKIGDEYDIGLKTYGRLIEPNDISY